jgi:hypothetical protein
MIDADVLFSALILLLVSALGDSSYIIYSSEPTLSLPALYDHNYQAVGLYPIRYYQSCSLIQILQ